jgi:hypothetical protein
MTDASGKSFVSDFQTRAMWANEFASLTANLLLHASRCLSASRRNSKQLHIYSCRGCRDPTALVTLVHVAFGDRLSNLGTGYR